MADAKLAIPGQLLGPAHKYQPGPGVHLYQDNLYSSLLGTVTVAQPPASTSSNTPAPPAPKGPAKRLNKITASLQQQHNNNNPPPLPTISVLPPRDADADDAATPQHKKKQREVLPTVGNVVLCRVTRITPRQAVVAILVCGDTVLEAEWQGVIRVQDVRATEKDRVKIYESFRPGDIVRASVVRFFIILILIPPPPQNCCCCCC